MKKLLLILFLLPYLAHTQPVLTKWIFNKNGKKASFWQNTAAQGTPATYVFNTTTDSADVLKVCYTTDSVWIRCNGMTDNMGQYLNPGACISQNYVFRLPRKPTTPTTKTVSPKEGTIGVLLNGIPIHGLSNANSWNGSANVGGPQGSKIWNVEVGKAEGFVLDTAFGAHPQQQGAYHSHATPFRLYKSTPTSQHSPLIGFAFDGYPIYGLYGYSSPTNAASTVSRMKTGYSLRNMTTRTTLPYGIAASQTGPPVNATYPIGTYCEDYEWLASNNGDLDKYNGRTCVTPDYPNGTYAYFVTIDAAGAIAFPYMIGIEYYGQPANANFQNSPNGNGLTMPSNGTCVVATPTGVKDFIKKNGDFMLYPNPTVGNVTLEFGDDVFTNVVVFNSIGQVVYSHILTNREGFSFDLKQNKGVYFVKCTNRETGVSAVKKLIVE